jgi:glycerol-3-phosphate dehydrogenase
LLLRLGEVLPGSGLSREDIITTFAGVRPLLRASRSAPSSRPREHQLVRLGDNLLTIAGGKYTTFRAISEQVVDAASRTLGRQTPPCTTMTTPLPDRRPSPSGEQICAAPAVRRSDVEHACRQEMACTVSDVMRRRTRLALSPFGGEDTARLVSQVMAAELGWSEDQRLDNMSQYLAEWRESRQCLAGPS